MGVTLTQYSLDKGLKEFGERGEQAVVKELHSLNSLTSTGEYMRPFFGELY